MAISRDPQTLKDLAAKLSNPNFIVRKERLLDAFMRKSSRAADLNFNPGPTMWDRTRPYDEVEPCHDAERAAARELEKQALDTDAIFWKHGDGVGYEGHIDLELLTAAIIHAYEKRRRADGVINEVYDISHRITGGQPDKSDPLGQYAALEVSFGLRGQTYHVHLNIDVDYINHLTRMSPTERQAHVRDLLGDALRSNPRLLERSAEEAKRREHDELRRQMAPRDQIDRAREDYYDERRKRFQRVSIDLGSADDMRVALDYTFNAGGGGSHSR